MNIVPFQAIEDRLGRLKSHPEEDITMMMDASHVVNDWEGGRPPLPRALKLERDYLFRLGTSLGRCAEKLVCLALLDAQRMAARSRFASGPDYIGQWAYFIGALTPALDHTEMETKVRGSAPLACRVHNHSTQTSNIRVAFRNIYSSPGSRLHF
jgi:hypothetical protein